eukprot:12320969-Heterocapsa_arctica.AAC.1
MVESGEATAAIWKGKGGGKDGKGGKGGKGKGKDGGKVATRPPMSSMSPTSATQEGWWMRPCARCHGRHMDAMCPINRPVGQP